MQARNQQRQQFNEAGAAGVIPSVFNQQLVEKWEATHILDGVRDPRYRGILSSVLENTTEEIERRAASLGEDLTMANAGAYAKTIFTILRRLFPNLIAPDIVSVQPMNSYSGLAFFMALNYDRAKGATAAGTEMIANLDRNYGSEFVQYERLVVADGVNYGGAAGGFLASTFQWVPVRPLNATRGFSVLIEDVVPVAGVDQSQWVVNQSAIDNGTGSFVFTPAGANTAGVLTYATGGLAGFRFQNIPTVGNIIRVTYYYDSELNDRIPAISANLTQIPIMAEPRKLKYRWSIESADALMSYHGVDADAFLTSSAAQELALELDRFILNALFAAAAGTTGAFDFTLQAGMSVTQHNEAFLARMADISARVATATHRGFANWFVAPPRIAARAKVPAIHQDYRGVYSQDLSTPVGSYDGTVVPQSHGPVSSHFGIQRMGIVSDSWLGFVDPYMVQNFVLLGYRGPDWPDAGYAWCPFIPLYITAVFEDPDDMSRKRAMMTRDATVLLRPEFYARIQITGGL